MSLIPYYYLQRISGRPLGSFAGTVLRFEK